MALMEDDDMEIQQLLTMPEKEDNLSECLGGIFGHNTHLMGNELDSLSREGAAVQKLFTDHEVEDYLEPSMLGCFSAPWRCSRRGKRLRRRSPWRAQVRELLGSGYPYTRGGGKCSSRKNNEHWTEVEMTELVAGVSRKGIGRWSKVKQGDYFSTSIRTAVHLKDKWRNLVRACKAKSTSKKKFLHPLQQVNVQKATEVIVRRFRRRILALEAKHLASGKKK